MDITSFLIGLQKGKALGANGQSPDVKYVTFMNGAETLYIKPVATGDDCVDVLTKGLISTPTKDRWRGGGWRRADSRHRESDGLCGVHQRGENLHHHLL